MESRSNPSRRTVLAGASTTCAAALAGCSSAFGDLFGEDENAQTREREVPDVPRAVETSGGHFDELADDIATHAEAALDRWDRLDDRGPGMRYHRFDVEYALEFAESLPTAPPTVGTTDTAGNRLKTAASADAYTAIETGDFERVPTSVIERLEGGTDVHGASTDATVDSYFDREATAIATEWLEDVDAVHESFVYDTDDPQAFLAYGRFVEYSLRQAAVTLSRLADGEDGIEHSNGVEDVAERYGSAHRGRAHVLDAESYREALRDRDPGGEPFDEAMANSRERFDERGKPLLEDYDDWSNRLDEMDDEAERSYVHSILHSRTNEKLLQRGSEYADEGYEVYGTVEMVRGWLSLVAASTERDRIEEAGADTIEPDHIDEAKRDAVDRLVDVLADDPGPLERLFAEDARRLVGSDDRDLETDDRGLGDDSANEARWKRSRANAYANYLLARGSLGHLEEAVDILIDGGGNGQRLSP